MFEQPRLVCLPFLSFGRCCTGDLVTLGVVSNQWFQTCSTNKVITPKCDTCFGLVNWGGGANFFLTR
jgi:hypothetical protein